MNNQERAAYIIETYGLNCTTCNEQKDICNLCRTRARIAVNGLNNAGLLAPDLPGPSKAGFWHTDNTVTRALTNRLVEAGFYSQGVDTYVKLTPDEARELAANLTAAANHAEGRQE